MSATPAGPTLTRGLVLVLGFLSAIGPFAIDMYLASLPQISRDLGAAPATVQLTLTAFLLGLGAGQLLLGPLSDTWGRRPVLLGATAVFAAASIALVFAPVIEVFIGLRLLQGLSGAAGVVIARAIAVDLSTGRTAVRALSLIATVGGLGPLVAPPIGGLVAGFAGWRGVLTALALIAAAMLLFAWLAVPESLPRSHRHTGGLRAMGASFAHFVHDPVYLGYAAAYASGFAGLMAYVSASPFVGQNILGMSPFLYGLGFAGGGSALLVANLANARFAPRVGPERMLAVGTSISALSATVMTVAAATGILSIPLFLACAFATMGSAGLTFGNASALGLARATTRNRGAGSALMGAGQFAAGALVTPIVGLWGEETALPMALTMLVGACLSLVLGLTSNRASHRR
ncbi:multidrug effflux MFS transporter [Microbacterium sp. EYE_5]|uniref:multidrug effflux MFS transporter n=1 Tax=unclassified Microbacterium TaxID=2609290 RepID=UPI0020050218|nr:MULTISPECIES: multidrug effflux MFS transporter [unclassified Microbacterium]MCK6080186.1 multidrug effflux MFS transporter [Microbacterium sp. EYE_382]MCK6085457.1 multidrug effflux MFS transporter [Microbacterium sp. EYE_384]MCK6122318.1 multidrug effflux MFS transporter [Microbacterium sp. EYE_80]MCK6126220.1 multidrug effflux MFS transporter [Microbacterium sp. EYE_79]MCK6141141.1 multidrug effflux MFS transporter [Microbacterium sp. EYE_39]